MGHVSSSAQWTRAITLLFSKVPFSSLIFYVDDIALGSRDFRSHLHKLEYVFQRLEFGNLKISPEKTHLFCKEIKFVGLKISREGISVDDERLKVVRDMPTPDSVKKVQQVLGFFNWSRKFIPEFAMIASPLYDLLQKGRTFQWSEKHDKAFSALKTALINSEALAIPELDDPHDSYELQTDASKLGYGAVLTQLIRGKRPRSRPGDLESPSRPGNTEERNPTTSCWNCSGEHG